MSTELEKILENNEQQTTLKLESSQSGQNKIADMIHQIGMCVMVIGILAGVIIGFTMTDPTSSSSYDPDPHPLRWVYGGALILSSFISGILFVGFGEVIKILHDIRANTKKG
ncbi:hypothetical protein [Cohnella soli]|uniref:Uncharacterized protein n=1 Tax=Cohnella soli TaxID=425005 RepID=A0ABW0HR21_9BACL